MLVSSSSGDLRFVTDGEVAGVLTPTMALAAVRDGCIHQATSRPDTGIMHLDHGAGEFHIKAGFGSDALMGCKLNAAFPDEAGRRSVRGVLVLFDSVKGRPIALMATPTLTRIRTAATSVLAIQAISGQSTVDQVCLFGTGTQASAHVDAFADLLGVESIRVLGRRPDAVEAFVDSMVSRHPRTRVEVAGPDDVRTAEVVVACTSSRAPVLAHEDLSPVGIVVGVGPDSPGKWELATDVLVNATVVTDL